jgi:hypothetical protein
MGRLVRAARFTLAVPGNADKQFLESLQLFPRDEPGRLMAAG